MRNNRSIANIGVAALLAVTIAGTSTPMIPPAVFANVSDNSAESETSDLITAKQNLDDRTNAYNRARALYEKARKSADAEAEVLAQLEEAYRKAGLEAQGLYRAFENLQKKSKDSIDTQIAELDQQMNEKRSEIAEAHKRKEQAQKELEKKQAEADALNEEIGRIQDELDATSESSGAISSLKGEIRNLEQKKSEAESDLASINSKIQELTPKAESAREEKEYWESKLSKLQSKEQAVSAELEKKKAEFSKAISRELDSEEQAEILRNDITSLESQLNNLNAEYNEVKAKRDSVEDTYETLNQYIDRRDSLNADVELYKSQYEDAKAQLELKKAELEENNTAISDLNSKREKLLSEYEALIKEKESLELEIENYKNMSDDSNEALLDRKQEFEKSLLEAQDLLESVGIDYVDGLSASYETGENMTISEYFDYMIKNSKELIEAGVTTEDYIEAIRYYYFNCFTPENLNKAMDIIDRTNEVRQSEPIASKLASERGLNGVAELTVGASSMKYSALNAAQFHFKTSAGHILFGTTAQNTSNQDKKLSGSSSENLARGYSNPVKAWYDDEIEDYRRYLNGETVDFSQYGHAVNLLNPSMNVVSVAYDGRSASQNFYNTYKLEHPEYYPNLAGATGLGMSTDQFRAGLASLQLERQINVNSISAQLDEINRKLENIANSGAESNSDESLASLETRLADLQDTIDLTQYELWQVDDSREETQNSNYSIESEISQLTWTIYDLTNAIANADSELAGYNGIDARLDTARNEYMDLNSELNSINDEIAETEASLGNVQETYVNMLNNTTDIQDLLRVLNGEISKLGTRLDAINANELTTQSNIAAISAELDELQRNLDSVMKEYNERQTVIQTANEALNSKYDELTELQAKNREQARETLNSLEESLKAADSAIKDLKGGIENLNKQIETARAKAQAAEKSKEELDETLDKLKEQTIDSDNLPGDLKNAADEYNAKIGKMEETATKIADQRIVVAGAEADASAAEAAMESAEKEMEAARIIYENESEVIPELNEAARIYGKSRYDTSITIADILRKAQQVDKFDTIIIATGENFADSLAGSYLSSVNKNAPIISMPFKAGPAQDKTVKYIQDNLKPGGKIYILGGTNAVPSSIEDKLGSNIKRLAGIDRYETNLMILNEAGIESADELLVATGTEFADSLSASATGRPILLVGETMTKLQHDFIANHFKNKTITVLGGTKAVTDGVFDRIRDINISTTRLAGKNRYETSRMIANKYYSDAKHAVFAYGYNFPDGLSGGPLAMYLKSPLIIADSNANNAAFLSDYTVKRNITNGYVLGGPTLISDEITRIILNCIDIVTYTE